MLREFGHLGFEVGNLGILHFVKALEHAIETEGTVHDIITFLRIFHLRSSRSSDFFRITVHVVNLVDRGLISDVVLGLRAVGSFYSALSPCVSVRGH